MDARERVRYDMFIRVDEFGKTNAADFPAGSVGATQFAVVADVITEIQSLIGEQTASRDDADLLLETKRRCAKISALRCRTSTKRRIRWFIRFRTSN